MSAAVAFGTLATVGLFAVAGCQSATRQATRASAPTDATAPGFGWFTAHAAPVGWRGADLPDGSASLAYPPGTRPVHADLGAVAAGTTAGDGTVVAYFNATPQQGAETPANWRHFRVDHLTDDDARSATLDAAASVLAFRGGTGTCVADHYVTRVGAHQYREIACLVTGRHGASVLVVAAPAAEWGREQYTLEQAVDSYVAG